MRSCDARDRLLAGTRGRPERELDADCPASRDFAGTGAIQNSSEPIADREAFVGQPRAFAGGACAVAPEHRA